MTKSNGWNFLTLILTLVYFLQWENGFAVKAGPVELYQDDQYNAIPSASYSNLQADLQPQVMDTGVEFLVDIDKPKNGKVLTTTDRIIRPLQHSKELEKRTRSHSLPQLEERSAMEEEESESDMEDEDNPSYPLRPLDSLLESYESRLANGHRAIIPDRQASVRQSAHSTPQFNYPVRSAYTIEDFQEPHPLIRNKKSRFNMPSGDTTERQENKRDLAIDQFPAGRNEAPGPDEGNFAAVSSTYARPSRAPLVRQDAFDMADQDVEESELRRIRDLIDQLLQKKRESRRVKVLPLSLDQEDNMGIEKIQVDNGDNDGSYNYQLQSPIYQRSVRHFNQQDVQDSDSLFEADEDESRSIRGAIRNPSPPSDRVRLLRAKSLKEAHQLADAVTAIRVPAIMARPMPAAFFFSEEEDDSEDEPEGQLANLQAKKDEFEQVSYVAPRRAVQLPKRSYQENKHYDMTDINDQGDYHNPDQEAIEDKEIYLPQLMFGDEEVYDGSDEGRPLDRLSDYYPSANLMERRSPRNAAYMQTDDYDDTDADQEWLDRGEFDGDQPARTILSTIEEPSKDENVDPAITGRFRVCRMVKQTFHKDLAFTGRTLEVDECLVTCERKEGQRVFSHIFNLVDWPCGKKDEGKCQHDGSCSVLL